MSVALTKMKLRAFTNVALDAGGKWVVDFPGYAGLTLNVVQKGGCWLSIKGSSQVVCLHAGDCFLLTGLGYGFCSSRNPADRDSTLEPSQWSGRMAAVTAKRWYICGI